MNEFLSPAPLPSNGGIFAFLNRLSPQMVFVLITAIFATACAFITPPIQIPDEPNHWLRVYQLTEGKFLSQNYGGYDPVSISDCVNTFVPVAFHPDVKTTLKTILDEFHRPLNPRITSFAAFPNTALYSAVPYAPQTLTMLIARKLRWPPIALLYAGRVGTVLGYILVGWAAIRITPILKWPACLMLTSPMGLFLAGSISADPMTTAAVFFATALVLRAVFSTTQLTPAGIIALALTMAGVTLCKSAYFPVAWLVLAIPRQNWGPGKRRWIAPLVIIAVSVIVFLAWSALSKPQHVREAGDDPADQLHWILHNPLTYTRIFFSSIWDQYQDLIYESVGVLGWLDTGMIHPFLDLFFCSLIWTTLAYDQPLRLRLWPRVVAAIAICASLAVVVTANYMVWDKIGNSRIEGLQGRYFLPITMLMLTLIHRRGSYVAQPKWMLGLMTFFSLYTIWVLLERYYPVNFTRMLFHV